MPNNQSETITDLSDELLFLIACCQTEATKEDENFIYTYLNDESLDLNTLIRLANQHGIFPLVYKSIMNLSKSHASLEQFLPDLKSVYSQIARRNMLMSAELIRIMKLLKDNDIEALAFKGPALAKMAYGDITLRQYGDLDILVDEKDLYQAAALIVDQNYEPMDSIEFLKNSAKIHVEKNYEFYGRKNGIKVEIHWRLINSSFLKKFKNYNVFSTQDTVHINNTPLPTLDTKILLLYLCNHGASHMWERLEWIVDIDKLVRVEGTSLNWDTIMILAASLQSKITLLLGLGLSKALFHTKLPPEIESQLNSAQISNLVSFVLQTFDSDLITKDHTSHEKNFKVFQFNLALQDSLLTKARFILHTLFDYSDRDVMSINLPKPLFFLYYPIRILRIINKYTLIPLKRLFIK